MDCLYPIKVENKRYGIDPSAYQFNVVPCGRCEACLRRRQQEWLVRLIKHQEKSWYSCFVTLTYDDEHLPEGMNVNKKDVQDYHKRLRALLGEERSKEFKYYLVSEYGSDTLRPHYHAVYFGVDQRDADTIQRAWQNGFVKVDAVTEGRIAYVTGYVIEKLFTPPDRIPVFNLISKNLGKCYLDGNANWHSDAPILERTFIPHHGKKMVMPRYYKERLYNRGQRRIYEKDCQEKAYEVYERRIDTYGMDKYAVAAASARRQFVEKINKIHQKKKQL